MNRDKVNLYTSHRVYSGPLELIRYTDELYDKKNRVVPLADRAGHSYFYQSTMSSPDKTQYTYGNVMNYSSSREVLNKFMIEQSVNFDYSGFKYNLVWYDIETATPDFKLG